MLSVFLFLQCNCFSNFCFLTRLTRRLSSKGNKSAMTSRVCALQNVSLHLVCIRHFLLLFSRPLDSPTQNILRCPLAEYLSAAQLNKPLTAVCGAMLSASHGPNVGFFSYHSYFTTRLLGFGSCARVVMGIKSYLKERSCFIWVK